MSEALALRALSDPPSSVAPVMSEPTPASDDFDYGDDGAPDDEAIAKAFAELDKLTLMAERATAERKRAEAALDKAKQTEDRLLNREIPELLQRMRLKECVTQSGIAVSVKRELRATLPGRERVEDRACAFQWLIDHGHGGVIKNEVTVSLDRGADDRANDLLVDLKSKGFDAECKKDVHAQTLGALARELGAAGTIMPKKFFNLFDLTVAKLSRRE